MENDELSVAERVAYLEGRLEMASKWSPFHRESGGAMDELEQLRQRVDQLERDVRELVTYFRAERDVKRQR